MLYTPHLLTGALVMKYSANPYIGLFSAFISHFILDLMPHNDFGLEPGITLRDFFSELAKNRIQNIKKASKKYFLALKKDSLKSIKAIFR